MRNSYRVHGALFFVALIYAANYSLSKDVMPRYMGPFGIVTLRIVGAALFFGIIHRIVAPHDKLVGRADNLRAIACGICGIGVNQPAVFLGPKSHFAHQRLLAPNHRAHCGGHCFGHIAE
ncbi:hypothetical protein ACFQT0_19920 [Hymenobacter humi]|uniref:EamA domain-containing protein n=1 Tax=Hymenobacter humi TaxID=1411620 RepID=A0ABW2U984_9BACT